MGGDCGGPEDAARAHQGHQGQGQRTQGMQPEEVQDIDGSEGAELEGRGEVMAGQLIVYNR